MNYKIQRGDTLSQIAKMYGVPLQELLAANSQIKNPNMIYAGHDLSIPVRPPVNPIPQGRPMMQPQSPMPNQFPGMATGANALQPPSMVPQQEPGLRSMSNVQQPEDMLNPMAMMMMAMAGRGMMPRGKAAPMQEASTIMPRRNAQLGQSIRNYRDPRMPPAPPSMQATTNRQLGDQGQQDVLDFIRSITRMQAE